jgi:adenosylhomocysteine nucleosidase
MAAVCEPWQKMNSQLPFVFIASDRREAEPWVSRWEISRPMDLPVHWARAGTRKGQDVIAIANGVGASRASDAIRAAQAAVKGFSGICSVGTGGALDNALLLSDVVVATAVTNGQTTWAAVDPHGPPARSGVVYSSRHIARTVEEKRKLNQAGAILVEMEAAGIARVAQELAVPFYCIRVVSDLADEAFFIDFQRFIMADGRFNVPRLMVQALAHPVRGLPELLRLQRRTADAAKKLGSFLAECQF